MTLPYTLARLSPSLIIRVYQVGDKYKPNDKEEYRQSGKIVGAITSFTRNEIKETVKRRSLGKRGILPFQVIPQNIDVKLTLKRVALYREEFLREIGNIDGSLAFQTKPLILQEVQRTPTGSSDIFEYHDCWFTTNPMTYNIMSSDLLIIKDIEIAVAYMKPMTRTFFGIPGLEATAVDLLGKVFKF